MQKDTRETFGYSPDAYYYCAPFSYMKKIVLSLSAAALLLGTPAAQAAFVSQPVEVVAGTATPAAAVSMTPVAAEAGTIATAKVVKAKKLSFFAKMKKMLRGGGGKSQLVALLLVIFLGGLGIHRFYLGYTWQGIVQLLTFGGFFGIWVLIDLVRIIIGTLEPKNGPYDSTF